MSAAPQASDPQIVDRALIGAGGLFAQDVAAGQKAMTLGHPNRGLCLDRPGRVTIDSIEAEMEAGEAEITAFTLLPWETEPDGKTVPGDGGKVIDRQCTADQNTFAKYALYITILKTSEETADGKQIVLHYTSNGHQYELRMWYRILLCGPGEYHVNGCAPI